MPPMNPKRPKGFYESVLRDWRVAGIVKGLTDEETVLLGAQFTGLAIAAMEVSADAHAAHLDLATRAMHSAYIGRMAVRQGFGRPVEPPKADA